MIPIRDIKPEDIRGVVYVDTGTPGRVNSVKLILQDGHVHTRNASRMPGYKLFPRSYHAAQARFNGPFGPYTPIGTKDGPRSTFGAKCLGSYLRPRPVNPERRLV